jgi:phospholipid/cholesterol/gamma-HCH transport system ATP-binding protein
VSAPVPDRADAPKSSPAPERAPKDGPAIRLVGVHKGFDSKKVLQGVDLTVRQGETHVVLGPSGSGKSCTLKLIVGLMQPDQGEVWVGTTRVDGARGRTLREVRSHCAYLFQSSALINWMSVGENVALPMLEEGELSRAEVDRKVDEYLASVHMEETRSQMPGELSGGQKRRAALARVLACEPEVILYDEPTAGLDPVMTANISDLIRRVQQEHGVTSILVTHDLAAAFSVGDRVSMLHEGRVVFEADAKSFQKSDHPVVRHFLSGGREAQGADPR